MTKGLTKKAIPAAEELVDKLHSFLESGDVGAETDRVEKELPKEPPRTIAKHRRRRSSQEYLVHEVGKDPGSGDWIKHKEVPRSILDDYLSQQSYPSTRAKVQTAPTINMIELPSRGKETSFPIFRLIVILSLIASILPCLTHRSFFDVGLGHL